MSEDGAELDIDLETRLRLFELEKRRKFQAFLKIPLYIFAVMAVTGFLWSVYSAVTATRGATIAREQLVELQQRLDNIATSAPLVTTIVTGEPPQRAAIDTATETSKVISLGCVPFDHVQSVAVAQAPRGTRFDGLTVIGVFGGGKCGYQVFNARYVPMGNGS